MPEMASELAHPHDVTYQIRREKTVRELLRFSEAELTQMLRRQQQLPGPRDASGGALTRRLLGDLITNPAVPDTVKDILGTSAGAGVADGSALVRQDLEPIAIALFIKRFPLFDVLAKVQSNGLVHAYDVIPSPDPNTTATGNTVSTVVNELGAVTFTAGTYARKTSPIAVFATGRGTSLKEQAAVAAGGMAWRPEKMELANGMTKLAYDVQTLLCQGNGTYAAGTAANEGGLYSSSPQYFDGLRLILGAVSGSVYAGNSATQLTQGPLSLTQAAKKVAAIAAQQGGIPDLFVTTINGKDQLDEENSANKRYTESTVEIVPGVQVNQIPWANGMLKVIAVPGFSFGTYTDAVSGATVEDAYVLQSDMLEIPWLFAEGITILELPTALDYTLSSRYIPFAMYGLAVKAPLWMGKVRRIAN